jgi:Thioredoxin like C-terminal domain
VSPEKAVLQAASGTAVFRFHARDLYLVLGPAKDGKPVRFRVKLDGAAPGEDHGGDTDANGVGSVEGHRLYRDLAAQGMKVRIGIEASGHARWFERLLGERSIWR